MRKYMKALRAFSIVGGALWIIAEFIEMQAGEYTSVSLYLSVLAYLIIGVGLWHIYFNLEGVLRTISAVITSAGLFIMSVMVTLMFESAVEFDRSIVETSISNPGFIIFIVGAVLLGIAMMTSVAFQNWAALIFILSPLLMLTASIFELDVIWQHAAVFIFGINLIVVSLLPTPVSPAEIASQ